MVCEPFATCGSGQKIGSGRAALHRAPVSWAPTFTARLGMSRAGGNLVDHTRAPPTLGRRVPKSGNYHERLCLPLLRRLMRPVHSARCAIARIGISFHLRWTHGRAAELKETFTCVSPLGCSSKRRHFGRARAPAGQASNTCCACQEEAATPLSKRTGSSLAAPARVELRIGGHYPIWISSCICI